jgi:sister chromatid cohesion protein PDS5
VCCRPESIDSILCGSLFPPDFPTKGTVKHWVMAAMHFDKVEMKALEQIFLQKQRYDSLSRLCSLIL